MLPLPNGGWVISLKFTRKEGHRYISEAENWEGVDLFYMNQASASSDFEVGDRRYVQVNKIEGDEIRMTNFNPGRSDQLLPSGSIVVDITDRSDDGYSVGKTGSFPFIDTVRIYGDAPGSVVSVPISAVAPLDGFAVSDISHYQWPNDGDMVRCFANQGQSTVRSLKHRFEFPVEDSAPYSGVAEVKTRYSDRQLLGSIERYESGRPGGGDVLTAEIDHSRSTNVAWFGEHGDRIQIGDYPPISGSVKVRITQQHHPVSGEVVFAPDDLPEVGEKVAMYISGNPGSEYARPIHFDARIKLEEPSEQSGRAIGEIVAVDDFIRARILSYEGGPSVGDIVAVDVKRGTSPVTATVQPDGIPIKIQEDVHVSNTIDVEIIDDGRPLTGVVESYRGTLPEVGERIMAHVDSGVTISTAEPPIGQPEWR